VHITITSFQINLYANKSYLIDVNPQIEILENTLTTAGKMRIVAKTAVVLMMYKRLRTKLFSKNFLAFNFLKVKTHVFEI